MKDRLLEYGVLVGEEHQQGRRFKVIGRQNIYYTNTALINRLSFMGLPYELQGPNYFYSYPYYQY